jgi:hypothetical protein
VEIDPNTIGEEAWWASEFVWVLWRKDKSLVSAGNEP